jgi:hypothetical protein
MMNIPTTPRRWYQFSIASLLWVMLVVALAVAGMRERSQRMALEARVAELTEQVQKLEPGTRSTLRTTTKQIHTSGEMRP